MFRFDEELKVYLHREPVDFRLSINGLDAQAVVTSRIGQRWCCDLQCRFGTERRYRRAEPVENIDDVFHADMPEGLAELEGQWNECRDVGCLLLTFAPCANEVGDARLPAGAAGGLDLGVQRTRRASFVLGSSHIGCQRLLQRCLERAELVGSWFAPVLRRIVNRCLQPLRNRVAGQPCHPRYLALRQVVDHVQPPDPANPCPW